MSTLELMRCNWIIRLRASSHDCDNGKPIKPVVIDCTIGRNKAKKNSDFGADISLASRGCSDKLNQDPNPKGCSKSYTSMNQSPKVTYAE